MANVYDKLKEMNITLPAPPPKGGVYTPVMEFGDHLLYCSGCGPDIGDPKHTIEASHILSEVSSQNTVFI